MRLVINNNSAEYWESTGELKKLIIEKGHLILSDLDEVISTRERCL